jgi:GNAT superfamily N-acetyltransferase
MKEEELTPLVRKTRQADVVSVLSLMEELKEISPASTDASVQATGDLLLHMSKVKETYENLVAEIEGRIVGFASMAFYKTFYHFGGTAMINELVVSKGSRGRGVGKALIEAAVQSARSRGMDELEVSTEFSNDDARQFYAKMGFTDQSLLFSMELKRS